MRTAKESLVIRAAAKWWKGRRPLAWTYKEHIESPTVNCASAVERDLSLAVANLLEEEE